MNYAFFSNFHMKRNFFFPVQMRQFLSALVYRHLEIA